MLTMENIPAAQVKGKTMAEIINATVVRQLRMLEERYMTMKTRSTIVKADK